MPDPARRATDVSGPAKYPYGMEGSFDPSSVIATWKLTKRYGANDALSDASIAVPAGTIYGFLGPNGAGKTTAIRLLMGFIKPTSGRATLFGRESWRDGVAARRDVGYLVPASALYPDLSGRDQLDYAARLSSRAPAIRQRLLASLELSEAALDRKLGTYSKGMRQKLALIAAMQTDPPLLILDEPTDGLDPLIQRNFEELLLWLRDRGRTIFMSSHDLTEVERTCELVAVVRNGTIVAEERIADLQRRHANRVAIRFKHDPPAELESLPGITIKTRRERDIDLLLVGDPTLLLELLGRCGVDDITINRASLEEIFIAYYEPVAAAPERAAG